MTVVKNTLKLTFLAAGLIALILLFFGSLLLTQIPSDKEIRGCMTTKLYQVKLCPGTADYVRYSEISSYLIKAVVTTEDSLFWQHSGFDFNEMQKSLSTNLKKGHYARGGSTITQQLSKNLFLSKDKTLTRKLLEALITLRIEKNLSKKEILERYLNVVQFGENLFGVKKASQFYFQKSPQNLDPAEAAFLAFLLPSPEKYSKSFFKKELTPFAQIRLSQILEHLYQYEKISSQEYESVRHHLHSMWKGQKDQSTEEVDLINEEQAEQELVDESE